MASKTTLNAKNLEALGVERLAELVESIDLAEVWNRRIEALSKGYKRRVGIAMALVHDPDILVLDEPITGLDPQSRLLVADFIRELCQEQGKT